MEIDAHDLLTAIGWLIALLVSIIGWVGTRIAHKLDELNETLRKIDADLREDITAVSLRVAQVEARCQINHQSNAGFQPADADLSSRFRRP